MEASYPDFESSGLQVVIAFHEIDLVPSVPRPRIYIHLGPPFNVFLDRVKKRKRIRQLARKNQPPGTLFGQA
jgi:hypothetical protein